MKAIARTELVMQAIHALTLEQTRIALAYLTTDERGDDVAEAIMFARGDLTRAEVSEA
jgi:hypothetical protein